jgi:hypothetical protein
MNSGLKHAEHASETPTGDSRSHAGSAGPHSNEPDLGSVVRELDLILASPFFHTSKRSQQFLKYVVQYRLDGHEEPLKERAIGTVLYNRPADYATGDDSVVRVQAGEVRRRLEQYYQEPPTGSQVHIDLPLGSYAAEFRWSSTLPHAGEQAAVAGLQPADGLSAPNESEFATRGRRTGFRIAISVCILAAAAAFFGYTIYQKRLADRALNRFWAPILATQKPALICLPKTVLYKPSRTLYQRTAQFPGEFDNEVDRMNGHPHLKPDEMVRWGDIVEFRDFGIGKGDVEAAFRLSGLLAKLGKDTELRIGSDYGWDDLRNAPAVIVGAFSNQWTMKITSPLHFAFVEDHGVFRIQEQGGAKRAWFDEIDPRTTDVAVDYGLVTRLVNSGTGQFVVDVAGVNAPGSEAAAELATSQDELDKALHNATPDWSRKNVQIVVKTTVTDAVAGPAQIVAVYVW